MTARDDFELVKWAVAKATELPAHEQGFAAADAFDRLFTPRQLRELVADGHTHAFLMIGSRWSPVMLSPETDKHLTEMAIPILHPDAMK